MQYTKLTYLEKVIHEMSHPIQTVHILSELMLKNQDSFSKDNKENLAHIHDAAEKLRKILRLLTSITNLKANKIAPHLDKLDLVKLVGQEIEYHQIRTKTSPDLKIDFISKVQSCVAEVDKFWLQQLLANLVINAINHCDKGIIEVCTEIVTKNGEDYFCLRISDEGCGIPEDELETIFLPLERGTHSIGKIPGSGIGLTIVKEVAEGHGGSVTARNNERGGATFEVMMPFKD